MAIAQMRDFSKATAFFTKLRINAISSFTLVRGLVVKTTVFGQTCIILYLKNLQKEQDLSKLS